MLHDIEHTLRASFFGFTAMLPLLAAGTINADPTAVQVLALIAVALNYHCFGYLHNDLVDLPVDRTEPQRANDPLVSGRLNETYARLFVAAQFPISLGIAWWLHASLNAWVHLIGAYTCGYLYNIYGKRCQVPMLTDALQGIGWYCFAMFGAWLIGTPLPLTFVIAVFGFAFIFLINGVHGGLRDLPNDLRCGRMTTAIYFGARPTSMGDVRSSAALQVFATFALALIVMPSGFCLVTNVFEYRPHTLVLTIVLWLALNTRGAWYFWQVIRTEQSERRRWIYAHLLFLLAPLLIAFVPMMGWAVRITVLGIWAITLLLFSEPVVRARRLVFGQATQ